jgi:hypothetical protein
MYQILDKDTISLEILPHLSVAKRGFKTKGWRIIRIECQIKIRYYFISDFTLGKAQI